ncbi:hypothetical protein AB0I81_46555 [Nonomuraea sp. NPDC050404]
MTGASTDDRPEPAAEGGRNTRRHELADGDGHMTGPGAANPPSEVAA